MSHRNALARLDLVSHFFGKTSAAFEGLAIA
jgi:hypothetical protein